MQGLAGAARAFAVLTAAAGAVWLSGCGRNPANTAADSAAATPQDQTQTQTVAAADDSGAGGLADGSYDCGGGYTYHAMGNVDIKGGQFRWRPYGEVTDGFASYSVDGSGAIHWGARFAGLDDPPAHIVDSTKESFGFNVRYQATPDSLIDTMSCHRM